MTGGTSNLANQPAMMMPTAFPLFVHRRDPESPFVLNSYRLREFFSGNAQYSLRVGCPTIGRERRPNSATYTRPYIRRTGQSMLSSWIRRSGHVANVRVTGNGKSTGRHR